MHATIQHNLTRLLECGAFGTIDGKLPGDDGALVPMSPHKWRTLAKAAEELDILPYIARGTEHLKGDRCLSPILSTYLADPSKTLDIRGYDTSKAQLYNHWTSKRLEEIREEEMNSPDLSEETLTVLDILVANADEIITRDISVSGIVWLGLYIRQNRERIDFGKLQQWLQYAGMVRLAALQGSILIQSLSFRQEELPFVAKQHKKAGSMFMRSLTKVFLKHSCSTATRMDVAMLETISHRFSSAISMVTDIEE